MRIKLGTPLKLCAIPELVTGQTTVLLPALQAITHLSTSSKEVERGDLFVALKGEHQDGHNYIQDAISRGASAILCKTGHTCLEDTAYYIYVEDTHEALANLAKAYIDKIPHTTIAVTGSVGKTTTRHYIATLLQEQYRVHECPENYNNLLGVSLTMLSTPPDTECLVLEFGMDGAGQISRLSKLAHPDIAVITNIGISHIEKLGTQQAICKAKLEILDGMTLGKLLIEGDDAYLSVYAPQGAITVSASCRGAMCRCGNERGDAHGTSFDFLSPVGKWVGLHIPTIGHHTLSCALFAIAVAQVMKIPEESVRRGLCQYKAIYQRQTTLQFGNVTVILDAYNACPASMRAALQTTTLLSQSTGGRGLALLGDMLELGDHSETYHEEIGTEVANCGIAHLFLVGRYAPAYYRGAIHAGMKQDDITFLNTTDVAQITSRLAPHDVLLIKGSRGNKLELLLPDLEKALT